MTVQELIDILRHAPPDAKVTVWEAYRDEETDDVSVSAMREGHIHIGCNVFGPTPGKGEGQ